MLDTDRCAVYTETPASLVEGLQMAKRSITLEAQLRERD